MKKIFLHFVLVASIFFSTSSLYAADACDQIVGKWKGNWYVWGLKFSAKGEGFKAGEDVYFNFRIHKCILPLDNFTMSGKCHDGKVVLSNRIASMGGTLTNNHLVIQGNHQEADLTKN